MSIEIKAWLIVILMTLIAPCALMVALDLTFGRPTGLVGLGAYVVALYSWVLGK